MTKWPQMFFARHGETSWNFEQRYQGKKDIPLNEKGQRQADAIGPLMVDLLATHDVDPTKIDWFASPLSRARETMERMRAGFDIDLPDVQYDDRLMEISFGIMEGKLHSELEPGTAVPSGQRVASYWDYRPPQGESYQDVADRLITFASGLNKTSVIVAHGGILRVVRQLVANEPREQSLNWQVPQGAIAHINNSQLNMHFADMDQIPG